MEEKKMRKSMMVLVVVLGLTGLVAVASAHMGDGGYSGWNGYGPGYGWNSGMGPGWMSHMGYGGDHPGRGTSARSYSTSHPPAMRHGDGSELPQGNLAPGTRMMGPRNDWCW